MSGLWLWVGLAFGEVFLLLFVLLLVAWIRSRAQAQLDRKATTKLLTKAKQQKADRAQVFETFLKENLSLEGDRLKAQTLALQRAELTFIQRFADIYRKRDAAAAAQFTVHLEEAIAPYHQLTGTGASVAGDSADNSDELEALRLENTRLSEELSVTMDTMSRMLSEYSTMFSGGEAAPSAGGVMPEDEEVPEVVAQEGDTEEAMQVREAAQLDEEELDIGEEASASVADVTDVSSGDAVLASDTAGSVDNDSLMGVDDDELSELFDGDDVADLDDAEDDSVAI